MSLIKRKGSGGGAVSSVTNSDGSITISPTTGTVVASINSGHTNTWSIVQNFSTLVSGISTTSRNIVTLNSDGSTGNGLTIDYTPAGGGLDSYVSLLLHFDNNLTDSETSGTPKTVTNHGSITFTTSPAKFSYSALFNGTNQYASIPYDASLDFGSGDFTIDFWVNSPNWATQDISSGGTIGVLLNSGNEPTNASYILRYNINGGSPQLQFYYYQGGYTSFTPSWSPSNNTWYHIAVVRNGTNLFMFVNGVQMSGSPFSISGAIASSGDQTNIGARNNGTIQYFYGYMDELRISKGIARWTSNFTPNTVAYSSAVAFPELVFSVSGATKAKIWTDGNNSDQLTISMGSTSYATLTSAGIATFTGQLIGKGTATTDSAATGYIGEYVTASLASGSATSLTTATAKTVTSISLTAGDWDVTGVVDFHPDTTTTTTYLRAGISTTNNTLGAADTYSTNPFAIAATSIDAAEITPTVRISISSTTTVYLIAMAGFAISTLTAYGTIRARRMR